MDKMTRYWHQIVGQRIDPDLLNAYRTAIPSSIDLSIEQKNDHYIAVINSIEKKKLPKDVLLITQADTNDDLVLMVNDLVLTYKNIPEAYRPYFKNILTPN